MRFREDLGLVHEVLKNNFGGKQMRNLDVIGIGAINYDYIFYCKNINNRIKKNDPEVGQENLSVNLEMIDDEIYSLLHSNNYNLQIGGSAYLAIKTISSISVGLNTGFVGVYSKPTKRELKAGFSNNLEQEFSHLKDRSWLFETEGEPGIALVKIYKGTRNTIDTVDLQFYSPTQLQFYSATFS